jgi:hypothetical protein
MESATIYIFPMRKGECAIEWEVIRIRSKGEYMGRVAAADEKAARKKAIEEFRITKTYEQNRLLIRRA